MTDDFNDPPLTPGLIGVIAGALSGLIMGAAIAVSIMWLVATI